MIKQNQIALIYLVNGADVNFELYCIKIKFDNGYYHYFVFTQTRGNYVSHHLNSLNNINL